jgi:hypothetical protein
MSDAEVTGLLNVTDTVTAPTFVGSLDGNAKTASSAGTATTANSAVSAGSATKATKDGNDNVITDTYLNKTNKAVAKQEIGIDAGYASSISVPANGYVDTTITFTTKFSEAPHVVCSLYTTGTAAGNGSMTAYVASKSATGATIRIANSGTTTGTRGVQWVAIGN